MRRLFCNIVIAAAVIAGVTGCAGASDDTTTTPLPLLPAGVVFSDQCTSALRPAADYMTAHSGGFDEQVREDLNRIIKEAYDVCTYQEYTTYVNIVVIPWIRSIG